MRQFNFCRIFDFHVAKLFRVKDFATLQALNELGVLVAGDDAYFGMSAGSCHRCYSELRMLFAQNCSDLAAKCKRLFLGDS